MHKNSREGWDFLFLTRNHSRLECKGWIWIQVGESQCLGERRGQGTVCGAGKKKKSVGGRGSINTPRSGSATVIFETRNFRENSRNFRELELHNRTSRLKLQSPELPGKNSELPGTGRTEQDSKLLGLFVAGKILV